MSLLGQFVLELSFFWPWKTIHHQTFKNFYRRPHKYQLHTTILKVKHKIYNNWNSIINVHQIAFVFKTVFCRIFNLVTSSADFQFSTNLRQLKIVQNIVLKLNALHYVSQYVSSKNLWNYSMNFVTSHFGKMNLWPVGTLLQHTL